MNKFFELSFDDQRRVLQQASARCGLIFGEKPYFIELIENMKVLEDRFHRF